jgi:hypothetical protein
MPTVSNVALSFKRDFSTDPTKTTSNIFLLLRAWPLRVLIAVETFLPIAASQWRTWVLRHHLYISQESPDDDLSGSKQAVSGTTEVFVGQQALHL